MLSQIREGIFPKKPNLLSGVKHMLTNMNNIILIILLITAAFIDVTKNKIPNFLTFPIMLIGLILNIIMNGFSGFLFSFWGFTFGSAIFFIPFAFGFMGAGDVKLMAAIGALKGFMFTAVSALFSAAAGLIVVFGYLIYKKKLFSYFRKYFIFIVRTILKITMFSDGNILGNKLKKFAYFNTADIKENEKLYIPYGLAIAIGTLIVLSGPFETYLNF